MPAGQRVRANNVFGLTTDNPLTAGAVSFNSAELALLPSITGQHAVITLDPLRQYGAPEIIVVTAHTAAATVATITRGQYGTSARSHPQGTVWTHAPIDEDVIEVLTSGTRPGNPYEGQFIYETDTNKLVGYGGVDWAPRDAGGVIGFTEKLTAQAGITTLVDLSGLSSTVTVGTGRMIRVTGSVSQFTRTAGTVTFVHLLVREGGTTLRSVAVAVPNTYNMATCEVIFTPTAGSHTYKLSADSDGTVTQEGDATLRAFILVEDIGAA